MGATCSQICCCCRPTGKHDKRSDSTTDFTLSDEREMWFEQDNIPLISARHDAEIVDISGDYTVKKSVIMRSPRGLVEVPSPTSSKHRTSHASIDERGDRLARSPQHITRSHSEEKAQRMHSPSSTGSSPSRSPHRRHQHREQRDSASSDSFVEVANSDGSDDSLASPPSAGGTVAASSVRNERDGRERVESKAESIRSRTSSVEDENAISASPRSSHSPSKASTGSPKKQGERYGRKNYRANSNRKKNT